VLSQPVRIVVDWGSSNFRAFLFSGDGEIIARHAASAGILSVKDGAFEAVLRREIGGWLKGSGTEIWLSGMITSRNGWVETPYAACPATLDDLASAALTRRLTDGCRLNFLPGVMMDGATTDVMRGEEIQIFGSVAADESATLVLPGTHSKWASVEKGRIAAFRTFLTGEVYALLTAHSIVGRLMPKERGPFDAAAFAGGVEQALAGGAGLLSDVFTVRSDALLGRLQPEAMADRLSGLVIGHEIAGALATAVKPGYMIIVGEAELAARYQQALAIAGIRSRLAEPERAVEGFRRLMAGA
jgi:2-dehydro-3-deoxygalactonokinase